MEKIKWALSVIAGAITVLSKKYAMILIFVAIVVVLDFITGIIKAKAIGEPISSKKGTVGFYKKMALFVGLFFGFFLDQFIPYAFNAIGLKLPIEGALFGMIIGCYIVINESISVCENLLQSNPEILPLWVIRLLKGAKKEIDTKVNDNDNEI